MDVEEAILIVEDKDFNDNHWDIENQLVPYGYPIKSVRVAVGRLLGLVNANLTPLPVIKVVVHCRKTKRTPISEAHYEKFQKYGVVITDLDVPLSTDEEKEDAKDAADREILARILLCFLSRF